MQAGSRARNTSCCSPRVERGTTFISSIGLPPTLTLSKAVQELKGNTSRWLNELEPPFIWQQGYSAFSVSQSQRQTVIDYIDRQAEHHAKWSFEQEYLALLKKSGIAYDERFVLG